MSTAEIVSKIKNFIDLRGGPYSNWYVGVTSDPGDRLLNGHGIKENVNVCIYFQADSSQSARDAEAYFINTLHTDGGEGGGDSSTTWVYAYKKTYGTKP